MRPHVLTMEAMGPYAAEVRVDFDELAHEGLFLIHGPTGSGKTSLLDGLCFALYGEVPGERGDRGLRSDHADRLATPRVSLEFSAQGGRYRVAREPFHEAAKKRGAGTTTRHPTATLVRLDAGHQATLATKPSEVRDEVKRLIGLTPTQFQQVILLPQGQFEEVLRGKPETREGLLKTLFHTVGFEDLTQWLADESRAKRAQVTEQQRHLHVLAQEAARRSADLVDPQATAPGRPGVDDDLLFAPGATGVPDQAGLDRLGERATDALATADAALEAADLDLRGRSAACTQQSTVAERWDRHRRAVVDKDRLLAAEAAMALARTSLVRAEQAEQIRPSLTEVARREVTVGAAGAAAARDLRAAERSRAGLLRPVPAVSELDLTVLPAARTVAGARQAIAAEVASLDALTDTVALEQQALAAARRHRADEARAGQAVQAATDELGRLRAALVAVDAEVSAAATARDRLPGLAEAAGVARAQADAARRLAPIRRRLVQAQEAHLASKEAAISAWTRSLDLRERYLEGIAAVLAEGLAPGTECQVCGSTEHPRPAEPADGSVTPAAVEAAERAVDAAHRAAEARGAAVAEVQRDEAEALGAAGPAAGDPEAAEAAADAARAEHRRAAVLAGTLADLLDRQEDLAHRSQKIEELTDAGRAQVDTSRTSAELKEQEAADAGMRLTKELGAGFRLPAALAALRSLDATLASLAEHAAASDEAHQALAQAAERVAADVAASPFTGVDDARAALLDDAGRRALARRIEAHDRQLMAAQDTLGDPLLADLPAERPDVEAAQAAVALAQRAKDRAVARRTKVHAAAERIDELARQHRELLARLVPLESDANLHEAVANRCAGRAAPKVSLQRWVLATYLEAICEHANRRLTSMTAGRYQLHVERESSHGAAKAGLDLWVHDAHTGTTRPVSSLSGGETFQASLALALGVADSVEARTGGVRLDALFVDEGFGTLDPESLQLAMDELDGLREGGRMVGLISHVAALRERIRVGIEVTPTEAGSTVRVGDIAAA